MNRIYTMSEQLLGQFQLLLKDRNGREASEKSCVFNFVKRYLLHKKGLWSTLDLTPNHRPNDCYSIFAERPLYLLQLGI